MRGDGPKAGGTFFGWAILRNFSLYLVPHGEAGRSIIKRGGGGRKTVALFYRVAHLQDPSILYLVSIGRWGGSGLRGGGPEASGTSLGWSISRNSIFYRVPMGRRGGSGLRGGGPVAGGASLGWAISRVSSILYLVPMGRRGGSGLRGGGAEESGASLGRAISRISSTEEAGSFDTSL